MVVRKARTDQGPQAELVSAKRALPFLQAKAKNAKGQLVRLREQNRTLKCDMDREFHKVQVNENEGTKAWRNNVVPATAIFHNIKLTIYKGKAKFLVEQCEAIDRFHELIPALRKLIKNWEWNNDDAADILTKVKKL